VVPLRRGGQYSGKVNEFMVVCGLPTDSYLLTGAYGRILSTIYWASRQLTFLRTPSLEAAILDDLRQAYGFIPLKIYDRRFELFRDRLTQLTVHFEPVLYLEPGNLYICGWEALARDAETMLVPNDLFRAAELYGREFTIELDTHLLKKATTGYRNALMEAKMRRPHEIQELSVNVYPESLMRTAYFETVRQIITDKVILPQKLVLEVSEKTPIPEIEDANGSETPLQVFRKRLEEYVKTFQVGFAIDDFGVGHASISRLARLNPAHVKIDRDILHHEYSEMTIHYVIDLVTRGRLRSPKVVIEGFDNSSRVKLDQLYNWGIRYVQGHIIGKAGPKLARLEEETVKYLESLISRDQGEG